MNRTLQIGLLAIVFAAQLAVPGWMLGKREWVLQTGTVYKFKTAPVDPVDAFRGRYVALGFDETLATWADAGLPPGSGSVYVTVTVGEDGYARLENATRHRPVDRESFFQAQIGWIETDNAVRVLLPFDRYYMNERKAPLAEQAYQEHSRRGSQDAYVTVRVRGGTAVLEQLYVAEQPIEDYLDAAEAQP